jgi:hypothetical protein
VPSKLADRIVVFVLFGDAWLARNIELVGDALS